MGQPSPQDEPFAQQYQHAIPWETEINFDSSGYDHKEPSTNVFMLPDVSSPGLSKFEEEEDAPTLVIPYHRRWSYLVSGWFPEIISCVVSVFALIALVVILRMNDGTPPTKILRHLTLNSLVEFMTSVSKVAFMVPIFSALSQLKWLWFKDIPRSLTDFELHENAAVGGLGSIRFSLSWRMFSKSPIAWLAAVIALTGFFTSPLTQQAIAYAPERRAVENGTASVLRSSTFSKSNAAGFNYTSEDQLLIQEAYLTAAYLGPNQKLPGVDPVCSSGDCEWPIYGSLGVCAEVVDLMKSKNASLLPEVREMMLAEVLNSRYTTVINGTFDPNGSTLYYPTFSIPFRTISTEFVESAPETVISQNFIGYSDTLVNTSNVLEFGKIKFLGVSLYLCTQSLSTRVKDGKHTTTVLSQTSRVLENTSPRLLNAMWNNVNWNDPLQPSGDSEPLCPGLMTNTSMTIGGTSDVPNLKYTIDPCTAEHLSQVYIVGTSGGVFLRRDMTIYGVVGQISQALGLAVYGSSNTSMPTPDQQFKNIKIMMENIAGSLTDYMRNSAASFVDATDTVVNGTTYAPETLIQIRWSFISCLVLQLSLTIVILIFTMVTTSKNKIQILKGDSLATMCALSEDFKDDLGGMGDMEQLLRRVEGVKVVLNRGEKGEIRGLDAV